MLKTLTTLMGLCVVAVTANAVSVSGMLVRAEIDGAEIKDVQTVLAAPYPQAGDSYAVKYIQYQLLVDESVVFIREGDVDLVDPDTLSSRVINSIDLSVGGRHLLAVTCDDSNQQIVGILVGSQALGPDAKASPRICLSVRAPTVESRNRTVSRLLSVLEIRLVKEHKYTPIKETSIDEAIKNLLSK